jgi:hypothetical protein
MCRYHLRLSTRPGTSAYVTSGDVIIDPSVRARPAECFFYFNFPVVTHAGGFPSFIYFVFFSKDRRSRVTIFVLDSVYFLISLLENCTSINHRVSEHLLHEYLVQFIETVWRAKPPGAVALRFSPGRHPPGSLNPYILYSP